MQRKIEILKDMLVFDMALFVSSRNAPHHKLGALRDDKNGCAAD